MGGFRVSWVPEMFGRFQKLADELYSEQCVQLSLGALWGIHDVKKKKRVLWTVHDTGSGPLPVLRSRAVPVAALLRSCRVCTPRFSSGPGAWMWAWSRTVARGSGCHPSVLGFLHLMGRDRERTDVCAPQRKAHILSWGQPLG